MTILAFDANRRTNAQAIYDAYELGYLTNSDYILDLTYGEGAFWKLWAPPARRLVRNDLDPMKGDHTQDFRRTIWEAGQFDVVVFDPPYGFRGTSKHPMDAQYGLGEYLSVNDRMELMLDGMIEAARLVKPGGYILFKLQDQVVSGEKVWQRILFANAAEHHRLRLVDELQVVGYRAQPQRKCKRCDGDGVIAAGENGLDFTPCPACGGSGKVDMVQKHSASNVSTLQVYTKER